MLTLGKKWRKPVKNGFSLLEMLVAVSIILAIATVAVPKFSTAGDKANQAKIQTDLRTISNAAALYKFDTGEYPTSVQVLADDKYLEFVPQPPKGAEAYSIADGIVKVTLNGTTYSSDDPEGTAATPT
ncbi:competence type IV pilus major pilin ComGC [uncultured Megasphaera sp.]|uniref:competence type IV pilus major pilin ComGC n=1 Tax=uncultured Megasphaera sp. TaxID=165188 RepID=UPI00259515AD|nr:prepilin-type N-terminal cleavage/methylation domain-containing protein [uncultured Megasphaera sp.]